MAMVMMMTTMMTMMTTMTTTMTMMTTMSENLAMVSRLGLDKMTTTMAKMSGSGSKRSFPSYG
jgi:hypothetical protein